MFAYVGGYTTADRNGRGDGIRVYRTGDPGREWDEVQHLGHLENPSLFTLRRDGSVLYSVHGARTLVSAFRRNPANGTLSLINQRPCGGANPVDLALDPTERFLVVANYASGTVAVLPLGADGAIEDVSAVHELTGRPGPDPEQQSSSHPHAVIFDPTGRFVIVPDKGYDAVFVFRFEAGRLALTHSVASLAGAAPRHCAFHPSLPLLYVNNELDSTVCLYRWDAGRIAPTQFVRTLAGGNALRNTTAEIAVAPDGRFVYVSNRGADSIAIFAAASGSGRLRYVGSERTCGKTPRFFTLDPGGTTLFVANQDSDTIVSFGRDREQGTLTQEGVVARCGSPSAISLVG
ncbi:MAG: lactonase family protein [Acetobacteraceae bacterium]|nr:lactonase family protein [Acetobacteraceae bacterium]